MLFFILFVLLILSKFSILFFSDNVMSTRVPAKAGTTVRGDTNASYFDAEVEPPLVKPLACVRHTVTSTKPLACV